MVWVMVVVRVMVRVLIFPPEPSEECVKVSHVIFECRVINHCMQDTFARATHSAYAAGRPSAARDDRVSCIQD